MKTGETQRQALCITVHLIKQSICDPIPLDKLKKHSTLPYITWGLIWYHKSLFKLMNGENGTTTFLPLDFKIGGQVGK